MMKEPSRCPNCKGNARSIGIEPSINGSELYRYFCLHCSAKLEQYASRVQADKFAAEFGSLTRLSS